MTESGTERTLGGIQGDTLLCWLFATANSLYSSMCVRLSKSSRGRYEDIHKLDENSMIFDKCFDFLHQENLIRTIRREICFGLIPKTLKRKHTVDTLASKRFQPVKTKIILLKMCSTFLQTMASYVIKAF